MFILIHLPNTPLYQLFFCSLHPNFIQEHHHSYPTAVLGHSSDRVPISVPRPWGSATQCRWPRAHPSSSASRDNQVPGTLSFGAPLPRGTPGKGHTPLCPCLACSARTARRALVSHPVPPCTCCLPRSALLPLPPCPAQRGPQRYSGEQTATLPCPDPARYGAHRAPLQPLVRS